MTVDGVGCTGWANLKYASCNWHPHEVHRLGQLGDCEVKQESITVCRVHEADHELNIHNILRQTPREGPREKKDI